MKKIRYKLVCAIFLLVIVGILLSPVVYFQILDEVRYNRRQPMREITFSLDSDVEDVAMVQRIHEYLNSFYLSSMHVTIFSSEDEGQPPYSYNIESDGDISVEMAEVIERFQGVEELKEYFEPLVPYIEASRQTVRFILQEETTSEIMKYEYDWQAKKLSLLYDNKSKRVIGMEYHGKKKSELTKEMRQKILKVFLEYCNLSIIDDWYFNGESMISQKAHLRLYLENDKEGWELGFELQE